MSKLGNVIATKATVSSNGVEYVWMLRSKGMKAWLSVKEAAEMLGVSEATIYEIMKTDPEFPFRVVRRKRQINALDLPGWWKKNTDRERYERIQVPTGTDLLKLTKQ